MSDPMQSLRTHLAELDDLQYASGLLGWDQHTMMPARGGAARADALATLERLTH